MDGHASEFHLSVLLCKSPYRPLPSSFSPTIRSSLSFIWLRSTFFLFCSFLLPLCVYTCVSKIMGKHFEVVKDTCRKKERQSMVRAFSETEEIQRNGKKRAKEMGWNGILNYYCGGFFFPLALSLSFHSILATTPSSTI